MSLSATLDDRDVGQVATVQGWSDFGDWIDGLNAERYPQPVHLYEHGWSQNLPELEKQLAAAAEETPPQGATASVVSGLLGIVRDRGAAEVLTVSDGVGSEAEEAAEAIS